MTPVGSSETKGSNAIFVYVVVILGLQIFLLTVGLEALQAGEERLAWSAAWLSVAMFVIVLGFARLLRRG